MAIPTTAPVIDAPMNILAMLRPSRGEPLRRRIINHVGNQRKVGNVVAPKNAVRARTEAKAGRLDRDSTGKLVDIVSIQSGGCRGAVGDGILLSGRSVEVKTDQTGRLEALL